MFKGKGAVAAHGRMLYPLLMAACLAAGFGVFWQRLVGQWGSGDNSYGYLIIPLFAYLCWDKKEQFCFAHFSWSPWGAVAALLAVALLFAGEAGSMETLIFVGLWGGVAAILVTLYGWRVRFLLFPLLILLFMVPLPAYINNILTFKLKLLASSLSAVMLRVSGVSVVQDGNIIDLGVSQLQVVDACSGLRYMMTLLLMSLLIGHFSLASRWRRGIIVCLVIPLAVLFNGMRIWLTGLLTVNGHGELAENLFHDFTGLILFLGAGAVLAGIALLLKKSERPRPALFDQGGPGRVWGSRPLILTCLLSLLFVASGWGLPQLRAGQHTPPRQSFDSFPMELGPWQGSRHFLSREILDSLWADDYLSATYTRPGSGNVVHLLIPYYSYQGTRHTAHAPQSCLLGSGWAVLRAEPRTFATGNGATKPVMTLLLGKGEETMVGGFFFLARGRVVTSPWLNKFYLVWDSLTRQRTDGALVRAEMAVA
ncbi:MAG: EpsI family protein, partial [Desulfobulbaceae bacterium]|nr:EpsI family protein [Desulfobulbaceae bacterium]